jgi:hypothetical protein
MHFVHRARLRVLLPLVLLASSSLLGACGDDEKAEPPDASGPTCTFDTAFAVGSDGVADPLAASATEARAGRAVAADFPADANPLLTWKPGDFILANDRIALVIEDVGASDLYDPWGGRPVGMTLVKDGKMVGAANFGELLVLTNRESVVTEHVSVINDGSDGHAAIVRASGFLRPLPFYEAITQPFFRNELPDIPAAIEYVLEPGAEHVDVYWVYHSPRISTEDVPTVMHGFMYGDRMPRFTPEAGFKESGAVPWLGAIDDLGASFAYQVPGVSLGEGIAESGFLAKFTDGFTIAACGETRHLHARLTIGGPGLDGLQQAMAREASTPMREITGTVLDSAGQPAAGVRVHAERATSGYLTRATTDASGHYALHVPADAAVRLTAYRRGDSAVIANDIGVDAATHDFTLPPAGRVHVTIKDAESGEALPARVQIMNGEGQGIPGVPGNFGEIGLQGGRLQVEFPMNGDITLPVPAGAWKVVVSRGYEYEIFEQSLPSVAGGQTVEVHATLDHSVDTTGTLCADTHIHTIRSNDSGDDATRKLAQGIADGLEIPVRSDHEWVDSFQPLIEALGLTRWAFGIGSIEMTSMELWGHAGVLPLVVDPDAPNNGAPHWQTYASATEPDTEFVTLHPPQVFQAVRQRPEAPIVIINHPLGGTNYFGFCGFDPLTGLVASPLDWDEDFNVVEVFNDSSWRGNREGTVASWLSLLDHGRRVFATGASDSHGITTSPTGYPRTCLHVGTDDPTQLTPNAVRDAIAAGHSTVSGGIYVDASIGHSGPGDDVTGAPSTVDVHVRVQAASWIDVDAIDLVVDGVTVDTIAIAPGDADPANPAVRFEKDFTIDVAPGKGSYVIVAAYGDSPMEPVQPGRVPFGVTNPIFLSR